MNSHFILSENSKTQIGPFLYRFMSPENAKLCIDKSSNWFSAPKDFNDPFDCNLEVDSSCDEEELKELLTKINSYNKNLKTLTLKEIEELTKFYVQNPKSFDELVNNPRKTEARDVGICCFSETYRHLLLWSHYTLGHQGLAIKFDIREDLEHFRYPYKVDYYSVPPLFNVVQHHRDPKAYQLAMATKSSVWKYEKEVRIIKHKSQHPKFKCDIKFNKTVIKEIIFGCNSSPDFIGDIISILKKKDYPLDIKIRQASRSKFKFKLDFKALELLNK